MSGLPYVLICRLGEMGSPLSVDAGAYHPRAEIGRGDSRQKCTRDRFATECRTIRPSTHYPPWRAPPCTDVVLSAAAYGVFFSPQDLEPLLPFSDLLLISIMRIQHLQ